MGNYPKCYQHIFDSSPKHILNAKGVYQVDPKLFRQGAVNKTKSADPEKIEKQIKEIDKMIAQLEELEELSKLSPDEKFDRLEAEEDEDELKERRKNQIDGEPDEDIDPKKELKRRRLVEDFKREFPDPEDARLKSELQSMDDAKYSVLSYNVAAIEPGDTLLQKISGGYKVSAPGDKFLEELGAGD